MDIVRDTKIDWLGLKWAFIGASLVLTVVSGYSIWTSGLNLGVDFTGGTLVYLKFGARPDNQRIRQSLNSAGLRAEEVSRFDEESANEVQIKLARESDELVDPGAESAAIFDALKAEFEADKVASGKQDLNNVSESELTAVIGQEDAEKVMDFRTRQSGLIRSFDDLPGLGLSAANLQKLQDGFYLGSFTLLSVESVGPKVGRELRERARNAVFWSIIGMLIYIAFRFRTIYGIAAIIALFHDVFLTLGLFSISGKEISLTVIAALLTLVGYSINDTIVVFDRVRENLKLMRRQDLGTVINASINQTLNRTILTSGMTFCAVFALYMLGGEALNGFSFALVVGIVVGTYSSVAIASPIVLWWDNFDNRRKARARA